MYVDLGSNHYVEYSSSNDYRELEVPQEGSDFFAETRKNVLRVIHPDDLEKVLTISDKDFMIVATQQGKKYQLEYRLLMSDGAHYVRLRAVRVDDDTHLIIALENIDDEVKSKQAMKDISEKNMIFSQIAESLAKQYGMIYYIDTETDSYNEFTASDEYKDFNISPTGNDFFGTSQRNVSVIVHPDDREQEIEKKLSAANEKAYRDEMIGVKNKAAFTEYMENLQEQIRQESIREFSFVICDVNGLKQVNDRFGHIEGDAYIRSACTLICNTWKHSPVIRIGGGEFAVVLQDSDYQNRQALGQQIEEQVRVNLKAGKVVVAIGMVDYVDGSGCSVNDVFEHADNRMYADKAALKGLS